MLRVYILGEMIALPEDTEELGPQSLGRATYRANCAPYTIRRRDRRARGPRPGRPRRRRDGHRRPLARRARRVPALSGLLPAGPRDKTWGLRSPTPTAPPSVPTTSSSSTRGSWTRPSRASSWPKTSPGSLRGVARGYFKRILAALREPGYRVQARLLMADWLGVPQCPRPRDLHRRARRPLPGGRLSPSDARPRRVLADVIPDALRVEADGYGRKHVLDATAEPSRTITASGFSAFAESYRLVTWPTAPGASSPWTRSRPSARSRPTTSSPGATGRAGRASATACRPS